MSIEFINQTTATSEITGGKAIYALSAFWKIPIKSDAKFIHIHILFEQNHMKMPVLQQECHRPLRMLCMLSTSTEHKKMHP